MTKELDRLIFVIEHERGKTACCAWGSAAEQDWCEWRWFRPGASDAEIAAQGAEHVREHAASMDSCEIEMGPVASTPTRRLTEQEREALADLLRQGQRQVEG